MNKMRKGFTMIELIFVIVIIGILAAVAIPKLAATRDDAKKVAILANVKTCIDNVVGTYTATGVEDITQEPCNDSALTVVIIANGNDANKLQVAYVIPGEGTQTINVDFKGSQVSF